MKARERLVPTLQFTLMYGQSFRPFVVGTIHVLKCFAGLKPQSS